MADPMRQAFLLTMEKVDRDNFENFASRCFIGDDKCLYINIGEFKDPMKITDPVHNYQPNQDIRPNDVLSILRGGFK